MIPAAFRGVRKTAKEVNKKLMTLYYWEKLPHITTLGPGKRYCVWVQGCARNCPGCISPASHPASTGKRIKPGVLAALILASGDEGITISGGEPFDQPAALYEMLQTVKKSKDLGVIVYTGYTYEELLRKQDADVDALLAVTDLLIDGPYVRALDDGLSLRGSSNQKVIDLSGRYREALSLYGRAGRESQILHCPEKDLIAGIPSHQNTP